MNIWFGRRWLKIGYALMRQHRYAQRRRIQEQNRQARRQQWRQKEDVLKYRSALPQGTSRAGRQKNFTKVDGFWVPTRPTVQQPGANAASVTGRTVTPPTLYAKPAIPKVLPCGHEYKAENVYLGFDGKRNCRICLK